MTSFAQILQFASPISDSCDISHPKMKQFLKIPKHIGSCKIVYPEFSFENVLCASLIKFDICFLRVSKVAVSRISKLSLFYLIITLQKKAKKNIEEIMLIVNTY